MGVRAQVDATIQAIGLRPELCQLLPDSIGRQVFQDALDAFVSGDDRRWWWEAFSRKSALRQVQDGWKLLIAIVPDRNEHVWFIVEDDTLPFYPVYDATPAAIEQILGECGFFEYYIVAKGMNWLICENHHNCLIGVGDQIINRLEQLVA